MTDQFEGTTENLQPGQPHLDVGEDAGARVGPSPEGAGYALLTNRNNLLEILSSGLVKPAALYTKYYPDLGAVCPEAVPLLSRDPSATLVDRMVGGDPGAFPVLLDIDLKDATGTAQAVLGDYRTERVEVLPDEDAVCLVVDGVVPANRITAVHFRSEQELQEHTARAYENVRDDAATLRVSPERFRGRRMNVKRMLPALSRTRQAAMASQPEQLARGDALGGALLMVAALVEQDARFPLTVLSRLLEPLHAPAGMSELAENVRNYPPLERRMAIFAAALLTGKDSAAPEVLMARSPGAAATAQESADPVADLLLIAAASTLAAMSPDDYYAEDALARTQEDLERALATTAYGTNATVPERYRTVLDATAAVLENSMDVEEFPVAEVPVATGLLQFLLRSEPSRAMARALQRHYPPEATAVAVALSGVLYGRAMIPVECRPGVEFERYADAMLARYLNSVGRGLRLPDPGDPIVDSRPSEVGQQEEVLKAADRILIRRRVPPPAAVVTAGTGENASPDDLEEQVRESIESTTPGASDEAFRRLSTSDLGSGPEKEAAVLLCRAAGWNSCVITTIRLERPGAVVTDMPRSEVRIEGFVSSSVSIRVDRFRKQLTTDIWTALPESVKREVEIVLEHSLEP